MRYEQAIETPAHEVSEDDDVPTAALATLMHEAGMARRESARSILEPAIGQSAWEMFAVTVDVHLLQHRTMSIETLYPKLLVLAEATVAALPNTAYRDGYRAVFNDIHDDADHWCKLTHIRHVTRYVHCAMAWDAVRFLASAGVDPQHITAVVTGDAIPDRRLAEPPAAERRVPRDPPEMAHVLPGGRWHRARDATRRILRRMMDALEQHGARRAKQIARQPHVIAMKERVERYWADLERASMDTTRPIVGINGQDLRGSIVGTWASLVALSWLSLFWGALVSAPFGVGFAIFGTAWAGMFIVPLWATLWGFFGMGAARDSTLKAVGFEPAAADSALARSTAHLARCLDIPVPTVGVFPDANAFAMGQDIDDATLAIGRPLLDRLTSSQLDAVIGHELGHIVSGDMRRMMLMRTFQGSMVWFAYFQGLKQIVRVVICWGAELYIMASSRRREFWADAIGAALTSKEAMIGALRVLDGLPPPTGEANVQARFMFHSPFASHPSTAARIEALEQETYIRQLPLVRG